MIRRPLIFLAAVLAGGCTVGPDYHRPETAAPASFRGPAAPGPGSLADQPWWDLFHDPVLTHLVGTALAQGYDARIAAVRVEQARSIEAQIHGQFLPAVGYQGNADRGKNAQLGNAFTAGNGATASGFDAYLGATWELDLWGRVRRLDEVARENYLASEAARCGVLLSLVGEVATEYFQLLELDEELAVAHTATTTFGDSFNLFEQRLQGGVASRLETASAEEAQAFSAAQIPALEREISEQENALEVLLGENPGPVQRGTSLNTQTLPPDVPAGLPSALLERRPDVLEAEAYARAANAQIGVTIGGFLPRIGLSALLGGASPKLQDLTSSKAGLWSLGANVSGPVFQGGALRGEYRQVQEEWEAAKLQYQQTALNAFSDVANALVARQKLAEERTQEERAVKAGQEAVAVSVQRYKAGQASYYEVLQAQEQLFPAEVALAKTRRDELIAVIQLYKALGGGWNLADADAWNAPSAR